MPRPGYGFGSQTGVFEATQKALIGQATWSKTPACVPTSHIFFAEWFSEMQISELIPLEHVDVRVRVATKTQLLKELSRQTAKITNIDESLVLRALNDREQLGSTGVGGGIALPHARIPGLKQSVGLLMSLERPIDYGAIDEGLVDLVGLLLLPDDAKSDANSALACIARRLREPGVAAELRKAKTAENFYKVLAPN